MGSGGESVKVRKLAALRRIREGAGKVCVAFDVVEAVRKDRELLNRFPGRTADTKELARRLR